MIRTEGVIVEWSRERGFGKVQCESIGTLVFDGSSVAQEDLRLGEHVVVEVVEFRGRNRVTLVQRDSRRNRPG